MSASPYFLLAANVARAQASSTTGRWVVRAFVLAHWESEHWDLGTSVEVEAVATWDAAEEVWKFSEERIVQPSRWKFELLSADEQDRAHEHLAEEASKAQARAGVKGGRS